MTTNCNLYFFCALKVYLSHGLCKKRKLSRSPYSVLNKSLMPPIDPIKLVASYGR